MTCRTCSSSTPTRSASKLWRASQPASASYLPCLLQRLWAPLPGVRKRAKNSCKAIKTSIICIKGLISIGLQACEMRPFFIYTANNLQVSFYKCHSKRKISPYEKQGMNLWQSFLKYGQNRLVRKIVVNAEKINVFPAQRQAGPRKIRWLLLRDAVYIKRGEIACFSGLFNLIYINLCLFRFI